jgi:hypothetical protein
MPLVHSYTPGGKNSQAIGSLALAGGGAGWGGGEDRLGAHHGHLGGRSWGGGSTRERTRRSRAAGATGGSAPANRRSGLDNKRMGELQGVLMEVGATRVVGDDGWRGSSPWMPMAAAMVVCGGTASREEGRRGPFYRRAQGSGRAFLARQGEGMRYGGATWPLYGEDAIGWAARVSAAIP